MKDSILIVDDSLVLRKNLREILEFTYKDKIILEAGNGMEAFEIFEEKRPYLIFMDIILPYSDGIEVVQKIRSIDGNVKIIMISSINQNQIVFKALQAGADYYITKPLKLERINEAINSVFLY